MKTSGSTGVHVLIPLGRQLTFAQSRQLAGVLARTVVERLPEIATVARRVSSRHGRVYVDYLQNGHGQLLVAPFCVRPLPGAPVSMPLRWREVTRRLDLGRYTIANAAARMRRLGDDPLRPLLEAKPDLIGALERLQERVPGLPSAWSVALWRRRAAGSIPGRMRPRPCALPGSHSLRRAFFQSRRRAAPVAA